MDIATVIGLFGGLGVIVAAIFIGGSVGTFLNVPSLVVVIGGTMMVTLCQISLAQFLGSFKVGLGAFFHKSAKPEDLIEEAIELADTARKEGILALESREIADPFLDSGIKLCIDGHAPEVVTKMLSKDINLTLERQATGIQMFKSVAEASPAMGMIGTLIGLVQMLANMDDPKSIGPAMAVALLTTLIRRDYRKRDRFADSCKAESRQRDRAPEQAAHSGIYLPVYRKAQIRVYCSSC